MVFSSILFLFYFLPIFFLVYQVIPYKLKNSWALAASLFFYAWGAPIFVFVITSVIVVDYFIVNKIHISNDKALRKKLLALSIIMKIGLLIFFKYSNFFVHNLNEVLHLIGFNQLGWIKIALPIGISFFTFQALTYSIDVYRRVHAPLKSIGDYLLYILLFPQLIAGPIVRYTEIADQLENRKEMETFDNKLLGFYRFVIGLSKKVLIANVLGAEADRAFGLSEELLSANSAWIGILAYTFQIYFDFSGYSDMAIGLGRMMGFKFPENFNNPYTSQSITEFWRRWHMTLGRFMRDYLYIPLGGNQLGVKRMYFNLAFVFIISGLWHGAAWTFIFWGAFHGLFLILDKLFLLNFYNRIGKYPSVLITFFITIFGWVIFRANSLSQAIFYTKALFKFDNISFHTDMHFWFIFAFAVLFSFITLSKKGLLLEKYLFYKETHSNKGFLGIGIMVLFLLILSSMAIISSAFNPFIYFRF